MGKIYSDFAPAESAYEMMQNVTMKEVRDGYVIVTADTRVVGDDSLEEKADIVLTIPVENLLMLVSNKSHLPCAGLCGQRRRTVGNQHSTGCSAPDDCAHRQPICRRRTSSEVVAYVLRVKRSLGL